jgi:hypothetical protein
LKFSKIVLGGTAALHAYRAWGAVIFLGEDGLTLSSCSLSSSCSIAAEKKRSTPNVERPMLNSAKLHRLWWPLALALIALIFAIVVLIIFLRLESWPARTARQSTAELERLGTNLRAAFVDIAHLQPRITINDRVYMEQTTPVSELVVLSRRIEVEHELLHTWVGSSKRVKLHGTFIAKAGFDLRKGLSIDIRPDEIILQLPHKWTCSHLKTDCGTAFPGRMFKANYQRCLSWLGRKQQKASCPPKPRKLCRSSSNNEFTRHSHCVWFSKTRRKVNSDQSTVISISSDACTCNYRLSIP